MIGENMILLSISAGVIAFICIAIMVVQNIRMRRIMNTLNRMLNSAIDGSFTEKTFDESLLSAMESRLNHYLSASVVSARNLASEKDKIKETLADISHQTKTPIANILLYSQLLEERELSEENRECVEKLEEQAKKLSFLITSLVKLSRLEAGVFVLNPADMEIVPMLTEVELQFADKAAGKGIDFSIEPVSASALYDRKWTTEAIGNIVDNAIKYTPKGGRIKISVREYDLFCRIDVKDSGMGISEEEQAKIFLRFYRSQKVSGQEGVGIGLYLVRQILAGQGGYIKVESVLGEGSVFSVFLPKKE